MQSRLDGLTGLRIFAALWVVLFHFRQVTPTGIFEYPLIDPIIKNGQYGVDLFFVLSGFILSHVYFKVFEKKIAKADAWSFISFRFARLYPVHLATFLIMVLLFVAEMLLTGRSSGQSERFTWQSVVTTLTLTQAWFPGIESPNLPSWSISAEWFAYLFFPLLCLLVALRRWAPIAMAVGGFGFGVLQSFYPSDLGRICAGFLIGMAAYHFCTRYHTSLNRLPFLGALATVLILLWAFMSSTPRLEVGLLLFGAVIVFLANERDWVTRMLSLRFLIYLGEVSYAVYMFHWVARVIVRVSLERVGIFDRLPSAFVVTTYVLATLIGAVLLYHFVEKPGRKKLRRLASWSPARRADAEH